MDILEGQGLQYPPVRKWGVTTEYTIKCTGQSQRDLQVWGSRVYNIRKHRQTEEGKGVVNQSVEVIPVVYNGVIGL